MKSDKTCNFTEFDFYRDETRKDLANCEPICITLNFLESADDPWPEYITQILNEVIVGDDHGKVCLRVTAHYDASVGELVQSWAFLDNSQNELRGKQATLAELRKLRPFFFQTALRAAKDQFHGQSTYWASFLRNKDIDNGARETLELALHSVNQEIVGAHVSFKDVTQEMNRISGLLDVGQSNAATVDPAPADVYKVLRNTIVNLITASNAKIPVRSHGEGTQSLSVFLLFCAYLKTRIQADVDINAEPIVAIEEPEAHLHPNAIRAVWYVVDGLPGQKIVATHSGDLVSEVPITKLRRIRRIDTATQCNSIPDALLDEDENRKLKHHLRRNRGELFFARCWLLVEGETEVSVFAECANLLNMDLHLKGVRIIEYSQAGGPGIFTKVADSLGIQWHLVVDGDSRKKEYVETAKLTLNGRPEAEHISILSFPNIDNLLCCNGYYQSYVDSLGKNKRAKLKEFKPGSDEFLSALNEIVNKSNKSSRKIISKPAAAMKAVFSMQENGEEGVPSEVKTILDRVSLLARNSE